jgi:cellulose synthase/poly-beta-1,6-N-acetylglucosamine synthase-like glycosyltransferase
MNLIVLLLYAFCLIGLAVYGLHTLGLTLIYLRSSRVAPSARVRSPAPPAYWPTVTVQLPVYNERYTVERLIDAVVRLDYPWERLQIQVLDDSTDLTTAIAQRAVARYQAQGVNIQLIHRADRTGFKAGALAAGLESATGELIAVFDADFVPRPDWLRRTVPEFRDPRLGCLQTRWGHLNRAYNALTRAQALGIDGHFVIEQTARARAGLLLNFNGTAGLWRRACIEDAGGWQRDTLTEDLDLSYRAQLRGWRIGYRPDVVVPAELPAQLDAFKRQQFRWAKGSLQTARKLARQVWQADLPCHVRLVALIHLTGYAVHPLMLLTLLLALPVGLWAGSALRIFPWFALAAIGPPLLYSLSRSEETPRLRDRLGVLPLLTLLGFGISLNNTVAAVQALTGRGGTFQRTPKFNLRDREGNWATTVYALPRNPVVWGELLLAGYALTTVALLWDRHGWAILPWMAIYAAGYLFVAGLSFVQGWQRHRAWRATRPSTSPALPPAVQTVAGTLYGESTRTRVG